MEKNGSNLHADLWKITWILSNSKLESFEIYITNMILSKNADEYLYIRDICIEKETWN